MTPSKVIKAYDGTIVFIDHIIKIMKSGNMSIATLVDGSTICLSQTSTPPATSVLSSHIHVAATFES